MIPDFDDNGNLPVGIHRCTLAEIQARFGQGSEERVVETAELVQFMEWARRSGVLRVLVDGSYITDKQAPNDVDIVLLRGLMTTAETGSVQELSEQWPFLHVMAAADEADLNRWAVDDFGVDRHGNQRGILEIEL